jgi:hypothetical protein
MYINTILVQAEIKQQETNTVLQDGTLIRKSACNLSLKNLVIVCALAQSTCTFPVQLPTAEYIHFSSLKNLTV